MTQTQQHDSSLSLTLTFELKVGAIGPSTDEPRLALERIANRAISCMKADLPAGLEIITTRCQTHTVAQARPASQAPRSINQIIQEHYIMQRPITDEEAARAIASLRKKCAANTLDDFERSLAVKLKLI